MTNTLGWIYIIEMTEASAYKIGWSSNPESRLDLMQWGCPYKLHLVGIWRAPRRSESKLHGLLRKYRMRGEWYRLNAYQVDAIKDYLEASTLPEIALALSPSGR